MLQLKIRYQSIVLILSMFLLQSCVVTGDQNKLLNSGKALLKGLTNIPLSNKDIAAGLKEALSIGAKRVVSKIGTKNGYLKDKAIHIFLPDNLKKVHDTLSQLGLGKYTKELEVKMNRAAEIAAPLAKKLFINAIKNMRWQDVIAIYKGNNDAATMYFKKTMTPSLKQMMQPVINKVLAEVGVVQAYNNVVNKYNRIPFVKKINLNLTEYVMDKGINGIFYYLAIEEAAIRTNPAKRSTALLKRVFAN